LYFMVSVVAIAVCAIIVTAILYWVASSLIAGSNSLRKLVETIDYNVHETVDLLQHSIKDISEITERASNQMEKIEHITTDVQSVARDASSSMHMLETTLVPTLINLRSLTGGIRKSVETWNEAGAARGVKRKTAPDEEGCTGAVSDEAGGDV
jgi:hypothetical protein